MSIKSVHQYAEELKENYPKLTEFLSMSAEDVASLLIFNINFLIMQPYSVHHFFDHVD